jgi:hypothetical protein
MLRAERVHCQSLTSSCHVPGAVFPSARLCPCETAGLSTFFCALRVGRKLASAFPANGTSVGAAGTGSCMRSHDPRRQLQAQGRIVVEAQGRTRACVPGAVFVRYPQISLATVRKLPYISNQRPYLPGPVLLGIFRSPFTTGGRSFTSSYTSVMNRSLLCFVSPSVVAS